MESAIMMNQFPLYSSTRQMENRIICELLKELPEYFTDEYPAELLAERKIIFAAQIDATIKKSRPGLQTGDGGQ